MSAHIVQITIVPRRLAASWIKYMVRSKTCPMSNGDTTYNEIGINEAVQAFSSSCRWHVVMDRTQRNGIQSFA